jgi:fumarate hydratase class I
MPVTVAVDSNGISVHNTGPAEWKEKIATNTALSKIAVTTA